MAVSLFLPARARQAFAAALDNATLRIEVELPAAAEPSPEVAEPSPAPSPDEPPQVEPAPATEEPAPQPAPSEPLLTIDGSGEESP